jgi:hypothetical protein
MNTDLKRVRDGHANDEPGNGSPLKKRSLGSSRPEGKEEDRLGDWMDVVEVSLQSVSRSSLEMNMNVSGDMSRKPIIPADQSSPNARKPFIVKC